MKLTAEFPIWLIDDSGCPQIYRGQRAHVSFHFTPEFIERAQDRESEGMTQVQDADYKICITVLRANDTLYPYPIVALGEASFSFSFETLKTNPSLLIEGDKVCGEGSFSVAEFSPTDFLPKYKTPLNLLPDMKITRIYAYPPDLRIGRTYPPHIPQEIDRIENSIFDSWFIEFDDEGLEVAGAQNVE